MDTVLEYPYSKIGEKFFPIIPVVIKYNDKEFPLGALIDAGATISIFRFDILKDLGIKLEKCKRIPLKGIGGSITAHSHEVSLIVGNKTIKTEVSFSKELEMKINVIGREGIFDNFIVCYNDKEKKVSLTEI